MFTPFDKYYPIYCNECNQFCREHPCPECISAHPFRSKPFKSTFYWIPCKDFDSCVYSSESEFVDSE